MRYIRQTLMISLFVVALCSGGFAFVGAQSKLTRGVFLPLLIGPAAAQNPLHTGEATFYDANGTGSCSFDASPEDMMIAAISHVDYGMANYCGAYVEAFGPSGSVVVRIVDMCPDAGCRQGHLDMSREAFAKIADPILGRVNITWRVVSPALNGPIAYHFKDGSNQWWTAVQIRNHRNPIAKFEYQNDAGAWIEASRVSYNFFIEPNGMGAGPYTFRVTDVYGNVLSDSGIVGGDNVTRAGSGQFPPGP